MGCLRPLPAISTMRAFRVILAVILGLALSRLRPRDLTWAPLLAILRRAVIGVHGHRAFLLVAPAAAAVRLGRGRGNLHAAKA